MSFSLQVTLSGICAFVRNTASGSNPICVVMPSIDDGRRSLDDEPLCPHESYIQYGFSRLPLTRQRLSFNYSPLNPSYNPPLVSVADLYLADMYLITNKLYVTSRDVVASNPPPLVKAQVMLSNGKLSPAVVENDWKLTDLDSTRIVQDRLAHDILLELKNLDTAEVVLQSLDGPSSQSISLTPAGASGVVTLRIVNTCKDYAPPYPYEAARRDRDFKWYYELATQDSRKQIVDYLADGSHAIRNLDVPIPRIAALNGGNNCFPSNPPGVVF